MTHPFTDSEPLEMLHKQLQDGAAQLWPLYQRKRTHGNLGPLHKGAATEQLLAHVAETSARLLHRLQDEIHLLPLAAVPVSCPCAHAHMMAGLQAAKASALMGRALAEYLQHGMSDKVAAGLQAAAKLQPNEPSVWNCLAHCYWEGGDMYMAQCCLLNSLKQRPTADAHQMMSLLVRQQSSSASQSSQSASTGSDATAGAISLLTPTTAATSTPSLYSSSSSGSTTSGSAMPATVSAVINAGGGLSGHASHGIGIGLPPPGPAESLALSLSHAQAALDMNTNDGYSWYVLAMARMASYFSTEQVPGMVAGRGRAESQGPPHQQVLDAFKQALTCGCADLADLYYNRAALHTFAQDFEAALQDYEAARRLDPTLPCDLQADSVCMLLAQLSLLVGSKGGLQGKQGAAVLALLARDKLKGAEQLPLLYHERLLLSNLSALHPGHNKGVAVLCRPLVFVAPPLNASATLYVVCIDTSGNCFVLALVRVAHNAFSMTQLLAVLHPEVLQVQVRCRGRDHKFPMLKVDSLSTVLVDGVPLPSSDVAVLQSTLAT